MSEYRFTNSLGVIPRPAFKVVQGLRWVLFNHPNLTIPVEAKDLMTMKSKDYPRRYGRTGVLLEGEWGREAQWYDPNMPWVAYIPLESPRANTSWCFQLDASIAEAGDASYTWFRIPRRWLERARNDLLDLHRLCESIRCNTYYGTKSPIPKLPDFAILAGPSEEELDVEISATNVQRCALNHLGFLAWWVGSGNWWCINLPINDQEEIRSWMVEGRKTRGVLIKLDRDVSHMNFANLVANDVPVAYPWTEVEATDPRFAMFAPDFLEAYHDFVDQNPAPASSLVSDIPNLLSICPKLGQYDEFGQPRSEDFVVEDRDLNEDDNELVYYVVEFKGWKARGVFGDFDREQLHNLYFFTRTSRGGVIELTYWAYRPLRCIEHNPAVRQQFLNKGYTLDPYAYEEWSPRERREVYKVRFAPLEGETYDELGRLVNSDTTTSLGRRLTDVPTGPRRGRNRGRGDLLRNQRPRSTDTYRSRDYRNSYDSYRPNYDAPTRGRGVDENLQRVSSSGVRNTRSRSASPTIVRAASVSPSEPSPIDNDDRLAFLASISEWALRFSHNGDISDVSRVPAGAVWNPNFLAHGILFVTPATEVRMRLWANCLDGWNGISDIIDRAINHNVAFRLGITPDKAPLFRPSLISQNDRAAHVFYEAGYKDPPLTFGMGGRDLYRRYQASLLQFLARPHAAAVIAMGGPVAWIGKRYGGSELVQRYLNGPSIQVTVHQKGYVDPDSAVYAQSDQISPEEEDIIYGHISYGSTQSDEWMFPTSNMLGIALTHWRGEWNPVCEDAYREIFKKLESGTGEPKTKREWVTWLRGPSHGAKKPQYVPDEAEFLVALERLTESFGTSWNAAPLATLSVPEPWKATNAHGN